jgi:hypothetical protein
VVASKLRLNLNGALLLLSAALLLLATNSARADLTSCATGSVCYYVAIQPIDVCSSAGAGCAPFNTLSKTGNPGAATSTTPIGFVDTTTGKDITRAIWNQIGVDLAWSPIKQYNNTTYQTLHVTSNATGTGYTSPDFMQLSQQYTPGGISSGTVPNPTSPSGVPVSSQPTVINMFFVTTLVPPTIGTTLYGFSWIKNNGVAISSSTFLPPFPITARLDNLAHELGHNLGLDHADSYNVGTPSTDVMTTGASRTEPASTSVAVADLTPGAVGYGSADQLNKTVQPTQNSGVALSGFLNPIASSTTTASAPSTDTITTALVVTNTSGDMTTITAAPNSTKPNTSINFDVTGPTSGRDGETLIGLILTLGKGLHFDPTNKVHFTYNSSLVTSTTYDHGNTGDPNCPDPATQCLVIQLTNPGLPANSFLDFSQGIVGAPGLVGSSGKTVTVADIANAGANITYKFSDGLIITSTLTPDGYGRLSANSQNPSSTVSTQIDPVVFTSIPNTLPCTPTFFEDAVACPNPNDTGVSDGNPADEPQAGGGG